MSECQNLKDPCDCHEPDCQDCNQQTADQENEREMAEHYRAIDDQERNSERSPDGGDDDWDEEDMHGSRPIEEPDEEDEEDEEDGN